jgi:DNA modification methylase
VRIERIGDATLYLGDCLEILPTLPKVDAVVTDPPYGLGKRMSGGTWSINQQWDAKPFGSLQAVIDAAEACIIWGGNYYSLPPCRGLLSWFKPDAPPSIGQFELAWTTLDRTARQISHSIAATNAERVSHPSQKPVRVMEWALSFVPHATTILDPFMGSGTTGVACANLGRKFIGIEIELRYFDIACERIAAAYAQGRLFA